VTDRPSREEAFEAFCTLVAFASAGVASVATYTQDALPAGVSRGLQRPLLADPPCVLRVTGPGRSPCARKRPDRDPPRDANRWHVVARGMASRAVARGRSRTRTRSSCDGLVVRARAGTEASGGPRSEGQVVVVRAVGVWGGSGVANGDPSARACRAKRRRGGRWCERARRRAPARGGCESRR